MSDSIAGRARKNIGNIGNPCGMNTMGQEDKKPNPLETLPHKRTVTPAIWTMIVSDRLRGECTADHLKSFAVIPGPVRPWHLGWWLWLAFRIFSIKSYRYKFGVCPICRRKVWKAQPMTIESGWKWNGSVVLLETSVSFHCTVCNIVYTHVL